jgi:flagellar protein FlaJ
MKDIEQGRTKSQKLVLASIATGAALGIGGIVLFITVARQTGGLLVILGLIIGVLPYGATSFLKNRKTAEMEGKFPDFLNDLAESKRGGQTLVQALDSSRDTDYGRLSEEVERIYDEMTWGVPFPEVMERFSERMSDSAVIQESITILLQSFQSGGNITRTIESIAEDSSRLQEVMDKKQNQVKQQVFIMYIIYILFVGITIGVYIMLAQLLGLGTPEEGALSSAEFLGNSGGATNFCNGDIVAAQPLCVNSQIFGLVPDNVSSFTSNYSRTYGYGRMAYYKSLLFMMLIIQGISTGAVAGQISEGTPAAGVKHATIMIPIAFVAFMFSIGLA